MLPERVELLTGTDLLMCLQIYLNYLANYVPNSWNHEQACTVCDHNMLDLSQLKVGPPPADQRVVPLAACRAVVEGEDDAECLPS